jgi:hypothetical protein
MREIAPFIGLGKGLQHLEPVLIFLIYRKGGEIALSELLLNVAPQVHVQFLFIFLKRKNVFNNCLPILLFKVSVQNLP